MEERSSLEGFELQLPRLIQSRGVSLVWGLECFGIPCTEDRILNSLVKGKLKIQGGERLCLGILSLLLVILLQNIKHHLAGLASSAVH